TASYRDLFFKIVMTSESSSRLPVVILISLNIRAYSGAKDAKSFGSAGGAGGGILSSRSINRFRASLSNLIGETPSRSLHDHVVSSLGIFCSEEVRISFAILTYSREILSLSSALCWSC